MVGQVVNSQDCLTAEDPSSGLGPHCTIASYTCLVGPPDSRKATHLTAWLSGKNIVHSVSVLKRVFKEFIFTLLINKSI